MRAAPRQVMAGLQVQRELPLPTEKYSVKDYDEDKTNVTASTTIWYKIDSDTLTIGGKGAISDYSNTSKLTNVLRFTQADWYMVKDTIKNVVIEAGLPALVRWPLLT